MWVNTDTCMRYRCVYNKKKDRVVIREQTMGKATRSNDQFPAPLLDPLCNLPCILYSRLSGRQWVHQKGFGSQRRRLHQVHL